MLRKLKQGGAIVFAKTNVPMSMLISETANHITGSTLVPYDRTSQAGGASGGQGAHLTLRRSPFGWEANVAGSIRIPAAFNNLWGLRTSSGQISVTGVANTLPGLPTAGSVVGPMCDELLSQACDGMASLLQGLGGRSKSRRFTLEEVRPQWYAH